MKLINKANVKALFSAYKKIQIKPSYKNPILQSSYTNIDDVAIIDEKSNYKYKYLIKQSECIKKKIEDLEIKNKNIAILLPNDVSFVIGMFGIWKSSNAVVPLPIKHPKTQIEYFLSDSESALVVTTSEINETFHDTFKKMEIKVMVIDDEIQPVSDEELAHFNTKKPKVLDKMVRSNAFIIYTSGTTGKPKGVVLSHLNVAAQVQSISDAWQITKADTCLHCLPLHHVHGIINALLCPLYQGGKVMMEPKFDAYEIWQKLTMLPTVEDFYPTIFMAVPTMYSKLIDMYHSKYDDKPFCKDFIKATLSSNNRLMVSGSAPLLPQVLEEWKEITGHVLLERYGMTEIGMALTNPLNGERKPGFVGKPFPGVQVRIAKFDPANESYKKVCEGDNSSTNVSSELFDDRIGELFVKSDNVFKEYWKRPEETAADFTSDRWFSTGDSAIYQNNSYKILGRTKVDMIKSGGFRVSALEVENVLYNYPGLVEIAVISVPDVTWGENICAILVLNEEISFDRTNFLQWSKKNLPYYQVPKVVKILKGELPRNPMGKVNKTELTKIVFSSVTVD